MGQSVSDSSVLEDDFYDFKMKHEKTILGPEDLKFMKELDENTLLTVTIGGLFQTWDINSKKKTKEFGKSHHYTDLVINKLQQDTILVFYAETHVIHKDKPRIKDFSTLWKNIIEEDETTHVAFHSIVWNWKLGKMVSEEKLLDGYHSIFFWNDKIIGQRGVHKFQLIEIDSGIELVKEEIEHNFDKFIKLTSCGDYLIGTLEDDTIVLVWDEEFKLIHKWRSEYEIKDVVGLKKDYILFGAMRKIYIMDIYTGKFKALEGHSSDITCMTLFDETLVSGDELGNIKVWSVEKVIEFFETSLHL